MSVLSGLLSKVPKPLAASVLLALCTYAVFEIAVTSLYLADVLEPLATVWLFENSGNTVHFDPVRGYRLTTTPSRITRITKGTVEYVGVLKGNNQGFPDRDDFAPARTTQRGKRFAVFGDSYTAAQYLGENWPDYVEDLTRSDDVPLELLNFSVDGGGLANWWSILTRLVEREGYEIDGVVFAVIPGNLWRGFSVSDHRGGDRPAFGRVPTWNPETFPSTLEQARAYLKPYTSNARIVQTAEFDRALAHEWHPKSDKPLRPYFASKLLRALRGRIPVETETPSAPRAFDSFDPYQRWMIEDIARALRTMNVPAMVVHVPSRESLLDRRGALPPPVDTSLFAALLGARLVDGSQAFAGRSESEIRAMWHAYDAHWAQGGSNAFGDYMARVLREWAAERESR